MCFIVYSIVNLLNYKYNFLFYSELDLRLLPWSELCFFQFSQEKKKKIKKSWQEEWIYYSKLLANLGKISILVVHLDPTPVVLNLIISYMTAKIRKD